MKREILYRSIRIFVLLLFVFITYILRLDLDTAYASSIDFLNSYKNQVELVDLSDGINLVNAYPVKDEVGLRNDGFKFKVINNTDNARLVRIYFNNTYEVVDERLDYSNLRYIVYKNGEVFKNCSTLNDEGILFEDTILEESDYEVKFWISYDSGFEILDKKFVGKITLI